MIERPLLMSAPMVRAILREIRAPGTGKTMTRRLGHAWLRWLTGPDRPRWLGFTEESFALAVKGRSEIRKRGPAGRRVTFTWTSDPIYSGGRPVWMCEPVVQPGDRLWIRETWRAEKAFDGIKPKDLPWWEVPGPDGRMPVWYEADGAAPALSPNGNPWGQKRVSLHLPAVGARLGLTVTDVKLEPLKDVSEDDARAEGARAFEQLCGRTAWTMDQEHGCAMTDARTAFWHFWSFLHGPGSWDANPHVVAVSFKPELIGHQPAAPGA